MSKEQLALPQLAVTKYDITERLRPGWPHHFHYEAKMHGVEFPVGYVSVRHWLAEARAEVDEVSLDNSDEYGTGSTVAIGQFMVRACARDLQSQGLAELRLPEPSGTEFSLLKDVFGKDGFSVTTYQRDIWPAPHERQLIELPPAELLARCLREQDQQEPTDEALELWVPLQSQNMANWPTTEIFPQPVYL